MVGGTSRGTKAKHQGQERKRERGREREREREMKERKERERDKKRKKGIGCIALQDRQYESPRMAPGLRISNAFTSLLMRTEYACSTIKGSSTPAFPVDMHPKKDAT